MNPLILSSVVFLFAVTMCAAQNCSRSEDYCLLCDDHVACTELPSECNKFKDVQFIDFDKEMQNHFCDITNDYRNSIANGSRSNIGLSGAAKMSTITWSCELANLCKLNVVQCAMKHDDCRSTDQFPYAGQNLAMNANGRGYLDSKVAARMANKLWFDEIEYVEPSMIDSLPPSFHDYGHFTQMMKDDANAMGCAAARFFDAPYFWTLTCCNYGMGNILFRPVYKTSVEPASECKGRPNPKYPGLCSVE